jgi:hypothetical protein
MPAQQIIDPIRAIGLSIVAFIPSLISAIILVVIGWIIGALIGQLVTSLLRRIHLGSLFERLGFHKAADSFDWAGFIGWLVEWFIIFFFLIPAFETLGLPQVSEFIIRIAAYIPRIIIAIAIIIIGAFIADALSRLVAQTIKGSKIIPASILAGAVKWGIIIFVVFAALDVLNIAESIVQILFAGIVGVLVIALGLAFGLGGQETVRKYLEKASSMVEKKK